MNDLQSHSEEFTLTSKVFANNEIMPALYTCDGRDINPPLKINNTPKGTKSLALIMDDPDAPPGVWDHWIKWNIPADTTFIEEGKEPQGVCGIGTSGNTDYHGPCPPSGTHHYVFKLYALDLVVNLIKKSSKKELEEAMVGHILGETSLTGLYKRQ